MAVRQAVSSHNPLVLILALVTAAGVAGAVYLYYVATGRETAELRRSFGALFFALGVFSLGGFVQLIWSDWAGFPVGHYSELFGTSTGLFSLMLIMAGFYLYTGLDLRMLAWPAALLGLFLLQGARAVVDFNLTRNPAVTFVLWLSAGLASVGMLPYAYSQEGSRRSLAYLGVVVLAVMALAALVTGVQAFYGHIAEVVRQQAR
jgi:putative membrane protein